MGIMYGTMRTPCRLTRRHFALAAAGAAPLALAAQTVSKAAASRLAMPGPYRGRVVAVHSERSMAGEKFQAEPIANMMRRGMMELTGAPSPVDAWRIFFEPGDVVGIKLTPVGMPYVIGCAEVVREIIAGIRSAGVKPQDIIVFDRYRAQFLKAGYDKWLPEKVRWSAASEEYDEIQVNIDGYDPDHYMEMPLVRPGQDPSNVTFRRSFAARFITKDVNKVVNAPCLKDHQSAGVTLALKNLSHGLVNNVSRSHSTSGLNACGSFIPAVVSMPVIRNKVVLNILDGLLGLCHGGPGSANRKQFVWAHHTLYFATDPVAVDRIGWKAIDERRLAIGLKRLVEDTPDKFSTFVHRQPEHVEIAGALGLGEYDEKKIDLRRVEL
jgi:uncharacterized protein (DUF362 family)